MGRNCINIRSLRIAPGLFCPVRCIKVLTLEISLKIKPAKKTYASDLVRGMKNVTMQKNLTCASSVGKASPIPVLFKDTKRVTVLRSPSCVNCVGEALLGWVTF